MPWPYLTYVTNLIITKFAVKQVVQNYEFIHVWSVYTAYHVGSTLLLAHSEVQRLSVVGHAFSQPLYRRFCELAALVLTSSQLRQSGGPLRLSTIEHALMPDVRCDDGAPRTDSNYDLFSLLQPSLFRAQLPGRLSYGSGLVSMGQNFLPDHRGDISTSNVLQQHPETAYRGRPSVFRRSI
jgi:hypothetical protein